jgi:hypothetical protein
MAPAVRQPNGTQLPLNHTPFTLLSPSDPHIAHTTQPRPHPATPPVHIHTHSPRTFRSTNTAAFCACRRIALPTLLHCPPNPAGAQTSARGPPRRACCVLMKPALVRGGEYGKCAHCQWSSCSRWLRFGRRGGGGDMRGCIGRSRSRRSCAVLCSVD